MSETGRAGTRPRLVALGGLLAGGGLALLASTQPWASVVLAEGEGAAHAIAVQGSDAAPASPTLALAALALVAAVLLTGAVVRVVLGCLGALLGAGILASAVPPLLDPLGAASGAVTSATGVAGRAAIERLVEHAEATPWGWIAAVGGALVLLAGALVAATARRWPVASHRYERAARGSPADPGRADDATRRRDEAIDDWDSLSRGDDPTG